MTTREFDWCAYTAKLRKFGDMMTTEGWPVILYGGEENEAACAEHVVVVPEGDRERWFGSIDWGTQTFDGWDEAEHWDVMNARTIWALKERIQQGDMICLVAGFRQQAIAEAFPQHRTIEPFVGYAGVFSECCAWESYAWMHHVYGLNHWDNGRFFDAVIPNYFEPDAFSSDLKRDDYLLFVGRLIERKGPQVAAQLAERTGRKLIVAGQGNAAMYAPGAEYVGVVSPEERRELMGRAAAVIMPTTYVEPFGGVAVEALMSGTPVITNDFGAFTETIQHGQNGWRTRSLGEMIEAVELLPDLWPAGKIARMAERRYSLAAVGPQFTDWLERVEGLQSGADFSGPVVRRPLPTRYGTRR